MAGRAAWAGRRSAAAAALAAFLASAPARSQVVTTDPSNTAQVAKTVTTLGSELSTINKELTTAGSILNVQHNISGALGALGVSQDDIGGLTVGQLVSKVQMGFTTITKGVGQAEQILNEVHNLEKDPLNSMSLLTMLQALSGSPSAQITSTNPNIATQLSAMNGLMSGSTSVPSSVSTIQNNMYTNALSPTAEQIENVNATRRAVVQNAAIVGMVQATTTQQSVSSHGQDSLGSLSQGVANAQDERGDIKANSSILLKVVEQVSAQNAMLAKLLYLESAQNMTTQGVYGPQAAPQGVLQ